MANCKEAGRVIIQMAILSAKVFIKMAIRWGIGRENGQMAIGDTK